MEREIKKGLKTAVESRFQGMDRLSAKLDRQSLREIENRLSKKLA